MNIFTIAILTCTSFIYNSKTTIDENAIKELTTCVKLASELKGKSGAAFTDKDYEKVMPNFTWVIRDS
jgi:hypothetical protein